MDWPKRGESLFGWIVPHEERDVVVCLLCRRADRRDDHVHVTMGAAQCQTCGWSEWIDTMVSWAEDFAKALGPR